MKDNNFPNGKHYRILSSEYKKIFGERVWKASLDAGLSCPNIDGSCGKGGCIFCSSGSAYFSRGGISIKKQIEEETGRIHAKCPGAKIIAYFQSNTNTYGRAEELREMYLEAVNSPFVCGISIATRADCLGDDIMEVLEEMAHRTYLTVELGMQTCHDRTLEFINRGYLHEKFKEGFEKLKSRKIRTCVHIIDGLPGESFEDMIETAREVALLHPEGLKIQLLHVISGTPLESLYRAKVFNTLTMEEYIKTVCTQLRYIPSDVVIERITGDGDRTKLVAPLWSASKIEVLNGIDRYLRENNIWQGDRASGQYSFHA